MACIYDMELDLNRSLGLVGDVCIQEEDIWKYNINLIQSEL